MSAKKVAPAKAIVEKTAPKNGEKYELTEMHGVGIGSIPAGTHVWVDATDTGPMPGVGGDEGVLFSWAPAEGGYRSAHLPQADFQKLFSKAAK